MQRERGWRRSLTFLPHCPSMTFPVCTSMTLAWKNAPRTLSRRLPSVPHTATIKVQAAYMHSFDAMSSCWPAEGQTERRAHEAAPMTPAPMAPATRPLTVTPPLVPRGTGRRSSERINRGGAVERMPSSLERVSAVTAAYCLYTRRS